MILGAGVYQLPLIKKAKDLNYYTIVVSYTGNYPGFGYADKVYYEDTTDSELILDIAKKENIDGIVTTGTDVAVVTLGKICDELNLKGITERTAIKSQNKKEMKAAFLENNVRTAKYFQISSLKEAENAYDKLQKPVMVKAVDSSGSRGIRKVQSKEELNDAFEYALQSSKKKYCVIEEFIEGEEFGVQAFVLEKKLMFAMAHGDYVFEGDVGVPIGHTVPYNLTSEISKDLKEQLQRSINALNFNNCALNADFILSEDGKVYVLEVGARAGATCLPEMVSITYNVDYYKDIILAAVGEVTTFSDYSGNTPCAAHLLLSSKEGHVKEMNYESSRNPNLIDLSFDCVVGDHVNEFKVGPDRVGQVITTGKTLEEAEELMFDIMDKIELIVE